MEKSTFDFLRILGYVG